MINNGCRIGRGRKTAFAAAGGFLIGFCYAAGYFLDNFDSLNLTEASFYGKWLAASLGIGLLLYGLWELADRLGSGRGYLGKSKGKNGGKEAAGERGAWYFNPRAAYIFCMVFLFLCWLPAFLSLFPGAFSYDAYEEWQQVHNHTVTAHHPVIHVLILGWLVEGFHRLTGSYNAGIAVYCLLQMLLMANVFSIALVFLRKFGASLHLRIFALLFYGFSPVVQLFSICATKDVPFSGAQLLFLLYVVFFYTRREEMLGSKKHLACFGLAAFFTMIFRNNGLYIVLITLLFMCISLGCITRESISLERKRKGQGKRFGCVLLGIAAAYAVYVGPFYGIFQAEPGGVEEMLSVPLQQMARVHRYDYDSLEQEDLELLYRYVPKEDLDMYKATVSDFVKKNFNREYFALHKSDFVKLWIKWGMEHPLTYLNSFLINTVDFWYPHAVVDGYRDAYGKSSFFDYQVDKPGSEVVLLPGVHDYYEKISHDKTVQTLPFVFLALSPGWYFVLFLVMALYLWRCRQKAFYVPMMIFVLTTMTVLLGPMALVRYVLIYYYGFPVVLSIFLQGKHFYGGKLPEKYAE